MPFKSTKVYQTVAVFLSLTFLVASSGSNNFGRYSVKTTKLECSTNPLRVVNCTCRLKALSWSKSVAHMEGTLLEPVRNATLRIELYKYTNQFRPFVINETVNICRWLETRERHNYAGWFLEMMIKFSNTNHTCPYTGVVKAVDMYFDTQLGSFVIPPGTYRFVFTFFEGYPYIHLGTIVAVGVVSEIDSSQSPTSRDRLY